MNVLLMAVQRLRKSLSFTVIVTLTMGLGIGANTAIFTLVHAVLLRSLPVDDPKMLYRVGEGASAGVMDGLQRDGSFSLFPYELYQHLRQNTPQFSQLAAFQSGPEQMVAQATGRSSDVGASPDSGSDAKSAITEYVSGNYFETLGVGSAMGRVLNEGDAKEGAPPTAVMSYSAWQADYASDPGVVGRAFTFQGTSVTVVGIAPPGFFGDRTSATPPAFWLPLSIEPMIEGTSSILKSPQYSWLFLLGRLKPGVSPKAVEPQMSTATRNWLNTQPSYLKNGGATDIPKQHVVLVPGGGGIQQLQQQTSKGLYLLMAICALVLLVACANVANLLLARASANKADTALRMALGASRRRIIGQILTESVVLACLGGLVGVGFAYAGTRMILSLAFPDSPQLPIQATPSLPVLGFAFLLALVTGVIFGVAPAWFSSHAQPADALRGSNRSTRDRASQPQRLLVVFQAALSLILLIGASLLTRSLANLQNQDLGLQVNNRYVVRIDPKSAGFNETTLPALYQSIRQKFQAVPGVEHVGLALYAPLEGTSWSSNIVVPGRKQGEAGGPEGNAQSQAVSDRVDSDFFAAVGEPLLQGRTFTESDSATSQPVAVVNESFVKRFFPGQSALGRSFGSQTRPDQFRVVGVVADAKFVDASKKADPVFFRPLTQAVLGPDGKVSQMESLAQFADCIVLDFNRQPPNIDGLVRTALKGVNSNLAILKIQTFSYEIGANFIQDRLLARLAALFGALALVLAGVGLYGVTSYQVARKTSEIGVRMALGATRGSVLGMVLRGAFLQVGIGLLIGLPLALIGAHEFASQLYDVKPYDPMSVTLAIAGLLLAATLAAFVPARRAASIEPMLALRSE